MSALFLIVALILETPTELSRKAILELCWPIVSACHAVLLRVI
jgi:hypothetical protein